MNSSRQLLKKVTLSFTLSLIICTPLIAQEFALERLENSPRHHEWIEIPSGDRTVHSFVAYPEHSENTPVLIVIHENRGLTDWVRSFADQVAEAGYLAIAPDLLSDFDAEHEKTSDFPNADEARNALYELDPDQVIQDLQAVQEHTAQLASSSGQIVVAGFCWGGSQTFRFATHATGLAAAVVFYGSAPTEEERIRNISAPVYGFYGENDQRINATIPETELLMEQNGKIYEYEIYEGAGHAYMRSGDDPEGTEANKAARDQSWERLKEILSAL